MRRWSGGLLERERELVHLAQLVADLREGRGAVLLVEGEAGIGKTALLERLRSDCAGHGVRVLDARGGELERDFAYGVARQLFEAVVRAADDAERQRLLAGAAALSAPVLGLAVALTATADAGPATAHGLYWLVSALADARPLVLLVDDAHWADAESLQVLHYLGRRLEGTPVLVAVAARPAVLGQAGAVLDAIRDLAVTSVARPAPLTDDAVRQLLATRRGNDPSEEVVRSCREATGGNPFLVEELSQELPPDDEGALAAVRHAAPSSVARSVLGRLRALHPSAVLLAEAVAVLDTDAELRHAVAVAALARPAAEQAADALVAARILAPGRPLRFVHPLVRRSVYGQIAERRRSALHRAAAQTLADEGAHDRAAVHLLAVEPSGDPWPVSVLAHAARRAVATGAPATAVRLLRRALDEPAPSPERHDLALALGRAERLAGRPAAVVTLRGALDSAATDDARVAAGRELAAALVLYGDVERAAAVLDDVAERLPPDARRQRLAVEAEYLAVTALADALAQRGAARLTRLLPQISGSLPEERLVLAAASHHRLFTSTPPVDEMVELAERATIDDLLVAEQGSASSSWVGPALALAFADRCARAGALVDAAATDARRRGSPAGFSAVAAVRARLALLTGDLVAAEAESRAVLHLATEIGPTYREHALGTLAYALLEQGRADVAADLLEAHGLHQGRLTATASSHTLLLARAALRRELGDVEGALLDAEDSLERQRRRGGVFPRPLTSGSRALAFRAAGDTARAAAEAEAELTAARAYGLPSVEGAALLVLAAVQPASDAVPLLEQAEALLATTPRRLDHARALVDLGAALRRSGRRTDARQPLAAGMDLAQRCGAGPLVDRAAQELRAAGARPRRTALTGVPALTSSELRVARLAADGMSNTEIAQALFVTRKTVETHLLHVYQKLHIRSRAELAPALPATATGTA